MLFGNWELGIVQGQLSRGNWADGIVNPNHDSLVKGFPRKPLQVKLKFLKGTMAIRTILHSPFPIPKKRFNLGINKTDLLPIAFMFLPFL